MLPSATQYCLKADVFQYSDFYLGHSEVQTVDHSLHNLIGDFKMLGVAVFLLEYELGVPTLSISEQLSNLTDLCRLVGKSAQNSSWDRE
jgi:hypothetical protein